MTDRGITQGSTVFGLFRSLGPFWIAAFVVVAGAIVEGYWSFRWQSSDAELALNPLAQAVEQVPLSIDVWKANEVVPPDPRVVEISGARAIFNTTYRDQTQGDAVTIYLLAGWSRDIAVHTPDACYPGAGFVMETSPQPFTVSYSAQDVRGPTRQAEFMTAVFTKSEPTGVTRLRVFWSWNDGRGWRAPRFPRWTYGGRRPLVKLYLVAESPPGQLPHQSSALRFGAVLLPILDARLEPALSSALLAHSSGTVNPR
ncbi:exosortase-associated EpsI family protein [Thermogutta sp.]|uniref:exosortase-associated EpsI family protein n=1 Tax=Thermogutta sp. TaxID=1962930 RepID=UPI00322088C6